MARLSRKRSGELTRFVETVLKKELEIGFVIKTDMTIEFLEDLPDLDNQEVINYIRDENYDIYVEKFGILKKRRFNIMAYSILGFRLYGDVLILKKNKKE